MRISKLLAVATAAIVTLGLGVVVSAAPAYATPLDVVVDFQIYGGGGTTGLKVKGEYGSFTDFTTGVRTRDTNEPVYGGTVTLQRKKPGKKTNWKNIETKDASGFVAFEKLKKFKGNAKFRVVYSGGPDRHAAGVEYAPALSAIGVTKTFRKLKVKTLNERSARLFLQAIVKPKYKKKKVVIQRQVCKKPAKRKQCKWKKFRQVKTNKKGKTQKVRVAASRLGIFYRVVVPKNKNFLKTVDGPYKAVVF